MEKPTTKDKSSAFWIAIIFIGSILSLIMFSCEKPHRNTDKVVEERGFWSNYEHVRESKRYKLRQLSSGDESYSKTSASFFLIAGSYSKESGEEYKIKVFCDSEAGYRMIDLNADKTYINIDNKLVIPEMSIYYTAADWREYKGLSYYFNCTCFIEKIIIYTPEKYFPESIESFNINQH